MNDFEERCVSVYRDLSRVPTLDNVIVARANNSDGIVHWEGVWSQRDLDRNSKVKFRSSGIIKQCDGKLEPLNCCGITELNGEKLVRLSPCGKKKAILREVTIKDTKHQFLEIWEGCCKVSNVDLTNEDKHGMVHDSALFGCMEWSQDSSKLLYVAEKKFPKSESFFKKSNNENMRRGDEFLYKEDWGEQLVGSHYPTLYIYIVSSGEILDFSQDIPEAISVSDALWLKDGKSIAFVGWHASPWKLGLMYCKNRLSTLYVMDVSNRITTSLTNGKGCVYSPRVSPNGENLIFLETIPFGPHMQCLKMFCVNFVGTAITEPRLVIDIVNQPSSSITFQGLFVDRIPRNCWLSSNKIVIHSIHRSNIAILCIDITTGAVDILERNGVWNILFVCDKFLFASHSSPNIPNVLKVGLLSSVELEIQWVNLETPFRNLTDIKWSIKVFQPELTNEEYPELDFEAILLEPSDQEQLRGLIVNPHGGPHVAGTSEFELFSACFCKLGFAVLRVNYRGSLGFGQNSVFSLPGNIGTQDVKDVFQASKSVVNELGIAQDQVFLHGGSHGGFLTLHLVGQFPDFYAAAGARNPVCNLASLVALTDTLDWCYVEGGLKFGYDKIPTSESLTRFLSCSPIQYVSQVKASLLFMIGSDDLRVPPAQPYEYIHALKGLQKKVRVLKYENNNHPISKVDAEADCFVNIAMLFHGERSSDMSS